MVLFLAIFRVSGNIPLVRVWLIMRVNGLQITFLLAFNNLDEKPSWWCGDEFVQSRGGGCPRLSPPCMGPVFCFAVSCGGTEDTSCWAWCVRGRRDFSLFRWVEFSRRPNTRVAVARLKAGGAISASIGSCSTWVGRIHPVMVRRAALRLTSTSRVWALLHHTGAQYSAGAYTSAIVDVLNVGVLAPKLVPARRRINAVRAMTLPRSAVRWSRYVSVLSRFTPR